MEDAYSTYQVCTVRIPPGAVAKIDERVRDGHAINRADYIRGAIYTSFKCE